MRMNMMVENGAGRLLNAEFGVRSAEWRGRDGSVFARASTRQVGFKVFQGISRFVFIFCRTRVAFALGHWETHPQFPKKILKGKLKYIKQFFIFPNRHESSEGKYADRGEAPSSKLQRSSKHQDPIPDASGCDQIRVLPASCRENY